jgi:hypothetical protein
MRRDDVSCSAGNGGFRRIEFGSRSGKAGEFRRWLCDPPLVAAFHGSNPIASRLAVAGKAVRIGRPPNLSAAEVPSDFHFESPALQNKSGESGAILTEISARYRDTRNSIVFT